MKVVKRIVFHQSKTIFYQPQSASFQLALSIRRSLQLIQNERHLCLDGLIFNFDDTF
jgi:hypothetical protein